jgi:putative redox protein
MITISAAGRDRLRVSVRGHELYTDQPVADGGEDTAPTPTEVFVAGLGACVAFYAERFLRRHGLPSRGLEVRCDYSWAENPHRVGAIDITVEAPTLPPDRREAFERVIDHCTVHNTLRVPPDVRVEVGAAPATPLRGPTRT